MKKLWANSKKFFTYYKIFTQSGVKKSETIIYLLYKIFNHLFKIEAIDSNLYNMRIKINFPPELYVQTVEPVSKSKYAHYLNQVFFRVEKKNSDSELVKTTPNKTFIWFVPNCSNVWGGGHYTIFRFANYFANQCKVKNIIFIYDYNSAYHESMARLRRELQQALPNCLLELHTEFDELPVCDAAIATTWQSAYFVERFRHAIRKFYFMQDYESLFYPAGTNALQANYTYSFGFSGITGGLWLKHMFQLHGGQAQEYIFCADRTIFYPEKNKIISSDIKRLFFYGRPSTERRAFELGMAALELIAYHFPEVEIVIAGLDGLEKPSFPCVLKGNLSLQSTGNLYRTCDIGIALSATNLSYLPVELMASGCCVITNSGPQVEWFCKHQQNALVVPPTPYDIYNAVKTLIEDPKLRSTLIKNGLETTSRTTWENEMKKIFLYMESLIHENETYPVVCEEQNLA